MGTFDSRLEAELALETHAGGSSSALGLALSSRTGDESTVTALAGQWLDRQRLRCEAGQLGRQTRRHYEALVRRYVLPYLGTENVSQLTPDRLERYQLTLSAEGLSNRTVQKAWAALARILKNANVSPNPCASVPAPRARARGRTVRPSVEAVNQFVAHTQSCSRCAPLAPLWRLAATTGMRRGELCGLAWDCIDLEGGLVRVKRSVGMDRGHFVKGPKSAAADRTIGIDAGTIELLRRLGAQQPIGTEHPLGLDLVFRNPRTGGLLGLNKASARFAQAWQHAGLPEGVTLHGLRHSHGSALLLQGLPVTQVAARLGHDPHVLLSIYAGELDEGARQRAMTAAAGALYPAGS